MTSDELMNLIFDKNKTFEEKEFELSRDLNNEVSGLSHIL